MLGKAPFEHLRLEVRGTNVRGEVGSGRLSPHPGNQIKTLGLTQNSLARSSSARSDATFAYRAWSVSLSLSVCLLTALPLPPCSVLIWSESADTTAFWKGINVYVPGQPGGKDRS